MKPALTKEEWGRFFPDPGKDALVRFTTKFYLMDVDKHAVAARCLHGQEFGFTGWDARMLWTMAAYADMSPDFTEDQADEFKDLADRIEALLPPEESDE